MEFVKTREVASPKRANKTDAGIDFFIPTNLAIKDMLDCNPKLSIYDFNLVNDGRGTVIGFILKPQQRVLIPSGIHVKLPKNHALIAFNKSGVASKSGLIVGSCVVDEGYEGEVHISLINSSNETVLLKPGAKIVQFICLPVNYTEVIESKINLEDFYKDSKSTRGDGGFGSTDKEVKKPVVPKSPTPPPLPPKEKKNEEKKQRKTVAKK